MKADKHFYPIKFALFAFSAFLAFFAFLPFYLFLFKNLLNNFQRCWDFKICNVIMIIDEKTVQEIFS